MSAIPAGVDAERSPPMTIPLRHFLVAIAFLVAALLARTAASGRPSWVAFVHLFLAGWVCLTIMGAMTQFVPVWSGVSLFSRRLAALQLPLAAVGFAGIAAGFLTGLSALVPVAGVAALAGVWTFVYNVARTLARARPLDVTEAHFALALAFFVLVTAAGLVLAADLAFGLLPLAGVGRSGLLAAHATLAVFGAVLTTVVGALYQLGTMFTQTDLDRLDRGLHRFESVAFPPGVLALAGGRLVGAATPARVGGLLVAAALFAVGVVLARRLVRARVDWTPMLSRYAVVAPSLCLWALLAGGAWLTAPLAPARLFGAPGSRPLLLVGVVGFVVLGTLYHVVPFIVWVHRYSDRLGFEDVPMIDDLYDDTLAAVDFGAFLLGGILLLGGEAGLFPHASMTAGTAVAGVGAVVFALNLVSVVVEHGSESLGRVVFGSLPPSRSAD